MNRSPWLPALVLAFGFAAPFGAAQAMQDEDAEQSDGQSSQTSDDDYETDDVIVITGGRLDKGMKAFMDGDYAQAEIEFEKNLECAERVRMLFEMANEQAVKDSIDAEYAAQQGGAGGGGGGSNGGFGGGGITPQETAGYYNSNPRNADEIKDRTCEQEAWQLYMIAMSQLQLGKYEEAKRNFYKVIYTSREPYLFDAHYRIALLEILDGNYDKAQERLDTLIVLQDRCHRRDERCEFRDEIDEIVAYLGPALERSRGEAAAG